MSQTERSTLYFKVIMQLESDLERKEYDALYYLLENLDTETLKNFLSENIYE